VRQITLAEADDIYEVRSALDELIGRKLASTITPTQVSALRALLDQMDNLAATGDVDGYLQTNLQFHDLLLNMTNNHKLINTYRRLVNELNLYRRSALAQTGSLPTSTAEHHKIVDAIATGNPQQAGQFMREHAMAGRHRMHCALDAAAASTNITSIEPQSN